MSDAPVKIGMTPVHPGEFVRAEILDELGLSVSAAAEVLDVRRANPLRSLERQGGAVGRNGAQGWAEPER